jgi:hypothetical protein
VQPVVTVQLWQIIDLPAKVGRVVEVECVARHALLIKTDNSD